MKCTEVVLVASGTRRLVRLHPSGEVVVADADGAVSEALHYSEVERIEADPTLLSAVELTATDEG